MLFLIIALLLLIIALIIYPFYKEKLNCEWREKQSAEIEMKIILKEHNKNKKKERDYV